MGTISQLKTWIAEYLLPDDLNAEFAQIINTLNALGNANWSAAGVDNLAGTKVDLETNTVFLAEHSAGGGHDSFANVNMDMGYIYRNAGTPDSKVDIVFNRATVYNSDTITTRLRKLIQDTGATTLTADIAAAAGVNALDTGATAAASTYYVWIILKSSDDTVASLLSLESTIAGLSLPTDYDYALMIGSVDTDGDSDFMPPKPIPGVGTAKTTPSLEAASSLAEDGYMIFGNGLILQWGTTAAVATDTDKTITFPLEFPTACFVVIPTFLDAAVDFTHPVHVKTAGTTTQVVIRNNTSVELDSIHWFAIGH